jgi:hypothetical protein
MALAIHRDCADCAIFYVGIERASRRHNLVELGSSNRNHEPAVVDLFQPLLCREPIGATVGQHHVRAMFHHRARRADRRARRTHSSDRARVPPRAVHDCRVEFDRAVGGQHAAAPGVEHRVFFQHPRRRLDRIKRASAFGQDHFAGIERGVQAAARQLFLFWRNDLGPHRAGPAMDHQFPTHRTALARATARY